MTFKNIRQGDNPFAFESLDHWAKELQIPARSLLHHSACGHLPVFSLPPHEVDYYAVHEDSFSDPLSATARAPIPLAAQGAMGLIVSNGDVAQLAAGKHGEVSWFYSLIRKNAGWTEITPPIPDHSGLLDREDGWWIATYYRAHTDDGARRDLHTPVSLKLAAGRPGLYVRNMDIASFAQRLRSGQFVGDLIIDGNAVENLPPYVSGKLREMFDANRLYWRNHEGIDPSEKERRRAGTRKYLQEDFWELCDKKSNPDSLLAFAADACDPSGVPATQRLGTQSVTPDLLAMLTAAKLFWSPHCSYEASDATYPSRDAIGDFLRFMGVRNLNTSVAATTIIRPEDVTTPPPAPKRSARTLLKQRQALTR